MKAKKEILQEYEQAKTNLNITILMKSINAVINWNQN